MHEHEISTMMRTDIKTPVRNRYFYGKLLDTYHFELETNYMNSKRWLLNRLISGYGVVCGLDVCPVPDGEGIEITPGVAIDRWGREIIVSRKTAPMPIPMPMNDGAATAMQGQHEHDHEEEEFVHLLICYHECESDPAPVLAGDCPSPEPCAAGAIRERYKFLWRSGCAPDLSIKMDIPDVIKNGKIDHPALVRFVCEAGCTNLPEDPCIPLANVRVVSDPEHKCGPEDIDVTIRPIVYTNHLLFQLLLSMLYESSPRYPRK